MHIIENNSKLINILSVFFSYIFDLEQKYVTFAEIVVGVNGYRRLLYNGYRYGTRGKEAKPNTIWLCTSDVLCPKTGKVRRCKSKLRTAVIDGNEMIESTNTKHEHEKNSSLPIKN